MTSTWKPVSIDWLKSDIESQLYLLEDGAINLWNLIKIEPVKWSLPPLGDEGGGFYVVAIWGKNVLWYNDIEDGYNISSYKEQGQIDEYYSNQNELHHSINYLYECIEKNT
ncbi:hypothetical protein R50072_36650 [Simiduia litorea]|uniref:hypothetical protein n=1 Tax=Simiduia litorea TaxID=1435348 RepID=UPI0036F1D7A8